MKIEKKEKEALYCPICHAPLMETKKGYSCTSWKKEDGGCPFTIWKESFGANFTKEDVKVLINGGEVIKSNTSQAGNIYKARWKLNEKYEQHFTYVP